MGKWIHVVENYDMEAGTVDCAHCGTVPLTIKNGRPKCSVARKASRGDKSGYIKGTHGVRRKDRHKYFEGKCCEICGTSENLNIDHDHKKEQVRGVLCFNHNVGIGHFHDSVEELRAAIEYLKKYT